MEEMRARDQHVLQLAEKVDNFTLLSDYETEQKVLRLEKIVSDLGKERSRSSDGFEYFVGGMVIVKFGFLQKTLNVVFFCKLIRELKNPRVNPPSASQTAI